MSTVTGWTGREVKALRQARRMSVRAFAEHLGVSDRMVSKWEAGADRIRPRQGNQRALDASLVSADAAVRARFEELTGEAVVPVATLRLAPGAQLVLRHPVDGGLMTLVDDGPCEVVSGGRVWLPGYFVDIHPVTRSGFGQFAETTGVPVSTMDGDALVRVSWLDAQTYCVWAGKSLPTPIQLQRAAAGVEGVVIADVAAEWCMLNQRAVRTGVAPRGPAYFRGVVMACEMFAMLAS